MQISEQGAAFIQRRESVVLQPHWDAIGKVWDVGFGHVYKEGEPRVALRDVSEARALFDIDILYYVDRTIAKILLPGETLEELSRRITQWMFDALVSLVYNVGHETLKRRADIAAATGQSVDAIEPKLLDYLDATGSDLQYAELYHAHVVVQLLTFRYARKQPIEGLLNRRAHEALLYARGEYE